MSVNFAEKKMVQQACSIVSLMRYPMPNFAERLLTTLCGDAWLSDVFELQTPQPIKLCFQFYPTGGEKPN